jgi:hypothetical protein
LAKLSKREEEYLFVYPIVERLKTKIFKF